MRFHLQKYVDGLPSPAAPLYYDQQTFLDWQQDLRVALKRCLAIRGKPSYQRVEKLYSRKHTSYIEEKYALDIGELEIPFYLLIPPVQPPFKTILLFNGHAPALDAVLGNSPNENELAEANYGQRLVEAGYLVCAVEGRGFGQRVTHQTNSSVPPNSCRHLAFEYLMRGETLAGERCWDAMCVLNYLLERDDLDANSIGCTGFSGGGTTALWLAALDERIRVAVPACCFSSFKASILAMPHCECNYIPGILALGDMGDFAALLAPRPLRVIGGELDPIFPLEAAKGQFEIVERAYQLLGEEKRCSLAVHAGAHHYHSAYAIEWFKQWL